MKIGKNNLSSFARQRLLKKIVLFFIIIVFFAFFGTIIWFLINGEFMKVTDFKISGTRMISSEEVISLLKGNDGRKRGLWKLVLPKNHRFAYLDNESLKTLIKEHFPRVKEVSILWDHSTRFITVHISERREIISWCSVSVLIESPKKELLNIEQNKASANGPLTGRENCFWLDGEGLAIGESPSSKGTLISVITDKSGREVILGETVISKEKLKNIIEIKKIIRDLGWAEEKTLIESPLLKEAVITIASGQNIFISLERSPYKEEKLILDTIISSNKWPRVEYVDLRIKGKGFYKLR